MWPLFKKTFSLEDKTEIDLFLEDSPAEWSDLWLKVEVRGDVACLYVRNYPDCDRVKLGCVRDGVAYTLEATVRERTEQSLLLSKKCRILNKAKVASSAARLSLEGCRGELLASIDIGEKSGGFRGGYPPSDWSLQKVHAVLCEYRVHLIRPLWLEGSLLSFHINLPLGATSHVVLLFPLYGSRVLSKGSVVSEQVEGKGRVVISGHHEWLPTTGHTIMKNRADLRRIG